MDSRETIAYVCEKAGIGHFADKEFYKYHDEEDEEGKSYHIEIENKNGIQKLLNLRRRRKPNYIHQELSKQGKRQSLLPKELHQNG